MDFLKSKKDVESVVHVEERKKRRSAECRSLWVWMRQG
jgi:hypothetical protein